MGNPHNFTTYTTMLGKDEPDLWVGLDTTETHATLGFMLISGTRGRNEPVLAKPGELVKFSISNRSWSKIGLLFHPSYLNLQYNSLDRSGGVYNLEYSIPNFESAVKTVK